MLKWIAVDNEYCHVQEHSGAGCGRSIFHVYGVCALWDAFYYRLPFYVDFHYGLLSYHNGKRWALSITIVFICLDFAQGYWSYCGVRTFTVHMTLAGVHQTCTRGTCIHFARAHGTFTHDMYQPTIHMYTWYTCLCRHTMTNKSHMIRLAVVREVWLGWFHHRQKISTGLSYVRCDCTCTYVADEDNVNLTFPVTSKCYRSLIEANCSLSHSHTHRKNEGREGWFSTATLYYAIVTSPAHACCKGIQVCEYHSNKCLSCYPEIKGFTPQTVSIYVKSGIVSSNAGVPTQHFFW